MKYNYCILLSLLCMIACPAQAQVTGSHGYSVLPIGADRAVTYRMRRSEYGSKHVRLDRALLGVARQTNLRLHTVVGSLRCVVPVHRRDIPCGLAVASRALRTVPVPIRQTSRLSYKTYADTGGPGSFVLGLAGTAGFVGGVAAGVSIGYLFDHETKDTLFPLTLGMVVGAFIGSALGPPSAVHLANGLRGNLLLSTLASSALMLAYIPDWTKQPFSRALLVPVAQITVSVVIEQLTDD